MSLNTLTSNIEMNPAGETSFAWNQNAVFFGALLSTFQAADGVLTSMGISRFGTGMEGNPILRELMNDFGCVPTLAVLKVLAILAISGLVFASKKVSWVKFALAGLTGVYLCAAILPWTYLLFLIPHA